MGTDLQEEHGACAGFGFVGQDADGAVGMKAVDDARACTDTDAEALRADGDAAIGANFERGAHTPDVGPPSAARHWSQDGALFALGGPRGGVGGAAQFAMDFVGVAVAAQVRQEDIGGGGRGDGVGGEEGGQAALPVLMLAFDFALGLGCERVAQRDAVEVERGSELGQSVGPLRKEQAVTIDVEFERQPVFGKGGGEEVEVSEQIVVVINGGPGANARAVIQQIEERIIFPVAGEPAVGRGIQLPERADLQALPAAQRSGRARRWQGMSQVLGDGPAAHGGGIEAEAQATMHFGGGAAIGRGRFGGEQLAQECRDAVGPVRGVVAARSSRRPAVFVVAGNGAQIVAVEFVEASATEAEFICGRDGRDFVAPEGGENFADQRSAETVGELKIIFFMVARMTVPSGLGECRAPALRAFRRPPLRSGLLQARRAGSVRLCAHACPGLLAHCSPLLATRHSIFTGVAVSDVREQEIPAIVTPEGFQTH